MIIIVNFIILLRRVVPVRKKLIWNGITWTVVAVDAADRDSDGRRDDSCG